MLCASCTLQDKRDNEMERFFATNGSYSTNPADFSLDVANGASLSENGHYKITIAAGATGKIQTSYIIKAVPSDEGAQAHDDCSEISLDSQGERLPNPATSDCW